MNIRTGIKLEIYKLRHTKCWLIHALVMGAVILLLGGYYTLYDSKETITRIKTIYELMGIYLPVFCSISMGILLKKEEQISNMYSLLSTPYKNRMLGGILVVGWLIMVLHILLLTISIFLLGGCCMVDLLILLHLFGGMIFLGAFYYIFHTFVNLKWGIGVSIIGSVFECMHAVIFSNIEVAKPFKYFPFAWTMEWKRAVLSEKAELLYVWLPNVLLLLLMLWGLLIWFEGWEGKKNSTIPSFW